MIEKSSINLDAEKGEVTARFGDENQRILLIESKAFVKMIDALYVFGTAGNTMLYMMGQEKGHHDALRGLEVIRQRKISITKSRMLENIVHHVNATGWGAPRMQKYDEIQGALTIHVENNPLVTSHGEGGKSDKPICHYFRGFWVGIATLILEKRVKCNETKCMSMGDPYCEFKITVTQ